MRTKVKFNDNWTFIKEGKEEAVSLPHTWNAKDGTDGRNDYYRGTCFYKKHFKRPESDGEVWLEFAGAAMSARVTLNGKVLKEHKGGYSTFRVDLTEALEEENELIVAVDNGVNREVYPQKADFTFYGGLYRNVYLLCVPKEHFDLDYYGGPGIRVTPELSEDLSAATVTVETWHNANNVKITCNNETQTVENKAVFTIEHPHLWDGKKDPFMYTVTAELESGDRVSADFGIRRIAFDPEKGFLLNNRVLRLCGTARHQDREGLGSALSEKEHEEDMAILLEMGANTIRLAHYQHDQYFYDLCDRAGMIVWAEIPYISEHMAEGRENTLSQMTELIVQNYNHPSIVCWGLSNEITAAGGVNDDMVANHRELNELCHRLDATRPTTMAHVFMLSPEDPFVLLPDIRSYNLYYGWYVGDYTQNDTFFDDWHRNHPDQVMGLSEYGADANPRYQSAHPEKGDWSEGYQALYHEHMLQMWSERPYIWAMHCWNGFDFGADGRDEGGKPGQNQKGLVTFDRKTKKDAFYLYKAYLSDEPFVHLCGRRYSDRTETETEIKVYSNLTEVTLYADGEKLETKCGDKIFRFQVNINGEHTIRATAGSCTDSMVIRHVEKPNPDYIKEGTDIVNWFDRDDEIEKEGYFSIKDAMSAIKADAEAAQVFYTLVAPLQEKLIAAYGDVAKNVQLPPEVQAMMDRMSAEQTLKQMGALITPEFVHKLNSALNQVRKK